jgi:hypothetical protein
VIRDAVIHQHGQLPLKVDLPAMPKASDVSVLCTNVRTMDNKRPSFIDDSASWFLIPVAAVSFIELPRDALAEAELEPSEPIMLGGPAQPDAPEPKPVEESPGLALETDEDLLARIRQL